MCWKFTGGHFTMKELSLQHIYHAYVFDKFWTQIKFPDRCCLGTVRYNNVSIQGKNTSVQNSYDAQTQPHGMIGKYKNSDVLEVYSGSFHDERTFVATHISCIFCGYFSINVQFCFALDFHVQDQVCSFIWIIFLFVNSCCSSGGPN